MDRSRACRSRRTAPLVHSSPSAFSTAVVLPGHGPSSKVSTTSFGSRKSSCLKCSKPKPGPPVVSISTTRPTPSASGLAAGRLLRGGRRRRGYRRGLAQRRRDLDVILRGILGGESAAAGGSGSAGRAAMVFGGAASARGAEVQYQIPAIATAATTLASIRPNALRIATLSTNATELDASPSRPAINAKELLTPHQHGAVRRRISRWISTKVTNVTEVPFEVRVITVDGAGSAHGRVIETTGPPSGANGSRT